MVKVHEYCCCAIPLLNIGIYSALLEQLVLAILVGTLSIATPKTVGADLPSFAPWVLAIVCYIAAGVQLLGFLGVFREKPKLYKTYTLLNSLVVPAVFGVAAAFIGVAWSRHNDAVNKCIANFFKSDGTSEIDNKSQTLCKVFVWINEGIMTGLWLILALLQFYLLMVTKFYGRAQSEDHKKYFSVYGDGGPDDILLDERPAGPTDVWDARSPPMSPTHAPPPGSSAGQYQHVRNASNASTIMNEPYQQPNVTGYEHYHDPSAMHRYQDDDDDNEPYAPPPGEPKYHNEPQSGYDYNRDGPQQPYPGGSNMSIIHEEPPQPQPQRYQLYDQKA